MSRKSFAHTKKALTKKTNWWYLGIGAFLLIVALFDHFGQSSEVDRNALVERDVVLRRPLRHFSGGRSSGSERYLFQVNEARADLRISKPGVMATRRAEMDSLQAGDTLSVLVDQSDLDDWDKDAEVSVYGLRHGSRVYFDPASYDRASRDYDRRTDIVLLATGLLFLLTGLRLIDTRGVILLIALFIIAVIVLTYTNRW